MLIKQLSIVLLSIDVVVLFKMEDYVPWPTVHGGTHCGAVKEKGKGGTWHTGKDTSIGEIDNR